MTKVDIKGEYPDKPEVDVGDYIQAKGRLYIIVLLNDTTDYKYALIDLEYGTCEIQTKSLDDLRVSMIYEFLHYHKLERIEVKGV